MGQRLLIPAAAPAHYTLSDYAPKHARAAKHAVSTVSETSRDTESQHSAAPATRDGADGGGKLVTQSAAQGSYSCSGLEELWEQEGGSPAAAFMAAEIAMAESGGEPERDQPDRRLRPLADQRLERLARHAQPVPERQVSDHPVRQRRRLEPVDHVPQRRLLRQVLSRGGFVPHIPMLLT